jgi:hypothetical protein
MSPRQAKQKARPAKRPETDVFSPDERVIPSLKLYRRIALCFVVVVAVVLGVVLYYSTVQATIKVKPVAETVKADLLLDVVKTPTKETEIRGRVLSTTLGKTETFKPSGQGQQTVTGTSRGTVTITNKGSAPQTLVKTTRLLTTDGKLYRIDAQVVVPAKGSVDAPAYADQPGGTFDIATAHFTIPGLPVSLQSVVFADAKTPFTGGSLTVSVVSSDDIARAEEQVKGELEKATQATLHDQAGTVFGGESFSTTVSDEKASVAPGAQAASFDITMDVSEVGVFFDREAAASLAQRKLYDQLTPGKEFRAVDASALQTTVEKVDLAGQTANLHVYLDGQAVPSAANHSLQPSRFVGMTADQVKAAIMADGIAEDVAVEFFPFWVHKVPRLPDHVIIQVE